LPAPSVLSFAVLRFAIAAVMIASSLFAALSLAADLPSSVPSTAPSIATRIAQPTAPSTAPATFTIDVRSLGAVGDAAHDDTDAIQRAIDLCPPGGEVVLPKGNYKSASLALHGNLTLRLAAGAVLSMTPDPAAFPLVSVRYEGRFVPGHEAFLHAENAEHLTILGPGKIQGPFALGNLRRPRGPAMIELTNCTNVTLDGFTTQYVRMWSIHLLYCDNVLAENLTQRSDLNRSNGDGIDVDSSRHVHITHCDMATGDDCISLKSGRGMEAVNIARPTEYIQIDHCRFVTSYAGIGIGTELSGGIAHVKISDCDFAQGSNGLFIKSRPDRGGYVDDVAAENCTAESKAFFRIDLLTKGIADSRPVDGAAGLTAVTNIRIDHAKVNVADAFDTYSASPEKPVVGITFANVWGTTQHPITLENEQNVDLVNLRLTGPTGPLILMHNATGSGLESAGPLPPRPPPKASPLKRAATQD
jgi:polygalacturonase